VAETCPSSGLMGWGRVGVHPGWNRVCGCVWLCVTAPARGLRARGCVWRNSVIIRMEWAVRRYMLAHARKNKIKNTRALEAQSQESIQPRYRPRQTSFFITHMKTR